MRNVYEEKTEKIKAKTENCLRTELREMSKRY